MESSVHLLYILKLWKTFCSKWVQQPQPKEFCNFLGIICGIIYAAFCIAIFFRWYLWRLKPQDIKPNSRITPSIPLRRRRLYPLFHLIPPKVPSAWMLLFIRSNAPWTLFKLFSTSLWNWVSSSLIRTTRFSLLLWHFSLCGQSVQSSHW